MRKLLWIGVVSFLTAAPAFAWGEKGHPLIADIAAAGLGPHARAQVTQLLGGKRMSDVALWADQMRAWQRARTATHPNPEPPDALVGDPVAHAFFDDRKNDHQDKWHFVDLPLGVTTYKLGHRGTHADDVVQTIKRCTAILKNHPAPGENITREQALRLLIHYVGDVHQPLHSCCGYWIGDPDKPARLATPAEAEQGNGIPDRGGNGLSFGPGEFQKLHTVWDGALIDGAQKPRTLAQYRQALITQASHGVAGPWVFKPSDKRQPEQWAVESGANSTPAYQQLKALSAQVGRPDSHGERTVKGTFTFPNNYSATFAPAIDRQLSNAGFRLAALLNEIFP